MTRIIVDCFGSDKSPHAQIQGSLMALEKFSDLSIILSGDEKLILKSLSNSYNKYKNRIQILHAPDVIASDDKTGEAVRRLKDSSMMKAIAFLKENNDVHALVSCGATGALVIAGSLKIGRANNVLRPAFCPILPTMNGKIVGICDSGATVNCNEKMLQQFAIMGSVYMKHVYNVKNPKVALLNIGTEQHKGDELHQNAYKILKQTKGINFVGNMESRDLLSGKYDLVVCDGFSGNVLVKATEGTAIDVLKKFKREAKSHFYYRVLFFFLRGFFKSFKALMDYQNYGGSVLLGINKTIVKGHGSSNATSVFKCIEQSYNLHKITINEKIEKQIQENLILD